MTNYEIIKAAAQKANPKLLELSFGCEILLPAAPELGINEDRIEKLHPDNAYLVSYERRVILGHEPQLFDIKAMLEYNGYEIGECFLDIVRNWTYPAGLSNQSEQTLNLILPYVQKNGE